MKVARRRGGVQLHADQVETTVLAGLIDDFATAVENDTLDGDDPVRQRLFPAGYADDERAAEFRELTEGVLRDERCARARECSAELRDQGGRLLLDEQDGERWLKVLNDLRLSLGTRLQIGEDDYERFDPDAPDADQRSVYLWLTAVQDALVGAVMG